MSTNQLVTASKLGRIRVVTADNPPVNALGHAVRAGLIQALQTVSDEDAAVVLICSGRSFFAGADIKEFGQPPKQPALRDVISALEGCAKPVVAAIHGTALGGGLEVALGCHFRIAASKATLGLPEVKLGLIPGAGGTQRLPRLIGVEKALDMIVSGKPIDAQDALRFGLIDEVVFDSDLQEAALKFAGRIADEAAPLRVLARSDDRVRGVDPGVFSKRLSEVAKRSRGLIAPTACVRAVEAATTLSFDEGLEAERRLFAELRDGDQSKAQRHIFFAEREAAKVPDIGRDVVARPVHTVAVVGAGTMGGGIAMAFADAGFPVKLLDLSVEALERGLGRIRGNYESTLARGGITRPDMDHRLGLIMGASEFSAVKDADLVVEAVFEDMAVKKDVFRQLVHHAKPDAILATNTSTLDTDEIARATGQPERVLGLHFFSPANVMRLLEIVRGQSTTKEAIATALAVARRIDKVPVVVGVCDGFVGNRMLGKRTREAERLLMSGALPEEVDRVLVSFGFPMGPFAMADLAGLDIGFNVRRARGTPMPIADAIYEMGRLGQKNGRGYYRYESGSRTPLPDPDVKQLILQMSQDAGVKRRTFEPHEILHRLLFPMINEGARILEEGIALRPSDIDVVWTSGYGWPVGTGGPMFYAECIGLRTIRDRLRQLSDELEEPSMYPAKLLDERANAGASHWKV